MAGSYMGIPREEIPWYPTINEDLCTNCGSCLDFCDNDVFEQGELTMKVVNPYNCVVGCDACARDCPEGAISFPDKKELVQKLRELREVYSR
ncbi:MAG: ferredoxin family protein [Calditrichia bacterium]